MMLRYIIICCLILLVIPTKAQKILYERCDIDFIRFVLGSTSGHESFTAFVDCHGQIRIAKGHYNEKDFSQEVVENMRMIFVRPLSKADFHFVSRIDTIKTIDFSLQSTDFIEQDEFINEPNSTVGCESKYWDVLTSFIYHQFEGELNSQELSVLQIHNDTRTFPWRKSYSVTQINRQAYENPILKYYETIGTLGLKMFDSFELESWSCDDIGSKRDLLAIQALQSDTNIVLLARISQEILIVHGKDLRIADASRCKLEDGMSIDQSRNIRRVVSLLAVETNRRMKISQRPDK